MKTLTVHGRDEKGELTPFLIINPVNLIVNTGTVKHPGETTGLDGKKNTVEEIKTFVHINGRPLIVEESVKAIEGMLNA